VLYYRVRDDVEKRNGMSMLYVNRCTKIPIQSVQIPIVLAITNLEREKRMEDWWDRNEGAFESYRIKAAGHACVTAADRLNGRHQELYEESRVTIRDLVEKISGGGREQVWLGGDNLLVSLMCKLRGLFWGRLRVRRKYVVGHLSRRYGVLGEGAKLVADRIMRGEAA
jgi:hypothetical protein